MRLRKIKGYPDYLVSDEGHVINKRLKIMMKVSTLKTGYRVVGLTVKGKQKMLTLHSIVAKAFLGEPPEGMEINHIDEDKGNNKLTNLEYLTRQENMEHTLACTWRLTNPEGEEVLIYNLAKYCREHEGLNKTGMGKLANGKIKSYKGWTKPE